MRRPIAPHYTVDRKVWQRAGAMALHRSGQGFDVIATRPAGYDRPWARAPNVAQADEAPAIGQPSMPARPRDATPNADDLEAGD